MSSFIDSAYELPSERRKNRRPFSCWELKRTFLFHRCFFTGAIIFPLTKAYYNSWFKVSERVTISEPDIAKWITPEAYTFQKLQLVDDIQS